MNFIVIIPARFDSSRLPGKPLADINGKPMVIHVMEIAQNSGADEVIIATDHCSVMDVVKRAGGEACLTNHSHQSGIERLEEVINLYGFSDNQIIVNLQGDEPLVPSTIIRQVANDLATGSTMSSMSTLAVPFLTVEEAVNPNAVKVVIDIHGHALYFSRSVIPLDYTETIRSCCHYHRNLWRHVGIYAYHANFVRRYVNWPVSSLEKIEALEQLRVLWYGEKIHVVTINTSFGSGVDTQKDLDRVRFLLQNENLL
ncbi:3-deoxy-manno-octulosonate cytidylyltransferase [Candidatus Curculioniphilus buchneri]|uniref:3-deoxy-manno-octulosonate cytidylyltransferase n=1 Tax=Candidatus Curculioniphilus buchneri TaxID=690594 RepID=UPI00376F0652